MNRHVALALIVPAFAAIFTGAVVTGYMMGQNSFRPAPPPPGLVMPSGALSGPATSGTGETAATGNASNPAQPETAPGASGTPTGSPSGTQPTPPSQPAAAAPGAAPPPSPPVQPAAPPAPPLLPAPPATPDTGPSVSPEIPEPPTRFHVQAGVFNDRDSAGTLVRQLRDRGYAVTLLEGPPYRVWVGGYLDRATAERLAANLLAAGFSAALTPR